MNAALRRVFETASEIDSSLRWPDTRCVTSETKSGRPGNEEVRSQTVRLDYGHFEKKSFISCTLVYGGGLPPTLLDCDFIDCRFAFEAQALNTAQFMASLAQSSGDAKDLILSMLGMK